MTAARISKPAAKAATKLTPWLSPESPPVRVGVYQVMDHRTTYYAYWSGKAFGYRAFTARDAFKCKNRYTRLPAHAKWRGLAADPSKAAE